MSDKGLVLQIFAEVETERRKRIANFDEDLIKYLLEIVINRDWGLSGYIEDIEDISISNRQEYPILEWGISVFYEDLGDIVIETNPSAYSSLTEKESLFWKWSLINNIPLGKSYKVQAIYSDIEDDRDFLRHMENKDTGLPPLNSPIPLTFAAGTLREIKKKKQRFYMPISEQIEKFRGDESGPNNAAVDILYGGFLHIWGRWLNHFAGKVIQNEFYPSYKPIRDERFILHVKET